MKRFIAIAGAAVIITMLTLIAVVYLPYGIGYMQTIKQHGEDAKQDIASVEFAGKIVKMEKGCISIKLAETLPFHKVLPIEYPYTYDDKTGVLRIHVNKTLWHYAKIGMYIDKQPGSDSMVVNNRSFAIFDKRYGRW